MMQYGTFFKLKCVKTTMFKFREISNYTQGNGALRLKLLPPETRWYEWESNSEVIWKSGFTLIHSRSYVMLTTTNSSIGRCSLQNVDSYHLRANLPPVSFKSTSEINCTQDTWKALYIIYSVALPEVRPDIGPLHCNSPWSHPSPPVISSQKSRNGGSMWVSVISLTACSTLHRKEMSAR